MQTSFKPARLSNLYKPAIILISMWIFVNLIGFFVQHDFTGTVVVAGMEGVKVSAGEYLIVERDEPVTPAPPKVKIQQKKLLLPSGETINPDLP